jgi:hypothetical protein
MENMKCEFPPSLPSSNLGRTIEDGYKLKESDPEGYAFYEHDVGFGFRHGLEIQKMGKQGDMSKSVFLVKSLSGNTFGKGTWLIVREEYFLTLEDAIGCLQGKERIYKPKRKPERIRALTEQQLCEYLNVPIPQ